MKTTLLCITPRSDLSIRYRVQVGDVVVNVDRSPDNSLTPSVDGTIGQREASSEEKLLASRDAVRFVAGLVRWGADRFVDPFPRGLR